MKMILSASFATLALVFSVNTADADIQPSELVAGAIGLRNNHVETYIYCGGTYGQTYPGGRLARLEVKEGSGGWRTIWSATLPPIGKNQYSIRVPFKTPVKAVTTFRLSISGSDRNPGNDVSTATFRPLNIFQPDNIRINPSSPYLKQFKKLPK